jgi:hypothetical protein
MFNLRLIFVHIGRCPRCMRLALTAALVGVAAAGTSWVTLGAREPTICLGAAAAALTVLWLAHLAAFAWRATAHVRIPDQEICGRTESIFLSRRQLLARFGMSFIGAAAASALAVALPSTAYAQVPCDNCEQYSGQQRSDCCLCKYNNCTSGCGNDNACVNQCLRTYNAC